MGLPRFTERLFARFLRSSTSKRLGSEAERLAEFYLRLKGYTVVERNWRTRWAEVDLVVKKGGVLVFVEVKARRSFRKGSPEEAVDERKRRRILKAAELFLAKNRLQGIRSVRFDVVAVSLFPKPSVRHIEGAFESE